MCWRKGVLLSFRSTLCLYEVHSEFEDPSMRKSRMVCNPSKTLELVSTSTSVGLSRTKLSVHNHEPSQNLEIFKSNLKVFKHENLMKVYCTMPHHIMPYRNAPYLAVPAPQLKSLAFAEQPTQAIVDFWLF